MKKNHLLLLTFCALPAVVFFLLSGWAVFLIFQKATLLSRPPNHGISYIVEADLSQVRGKTNVLSLLNKTIQQRFGKLGVRIFEEPLSESRTRIVVPVVDSMGFSTATNLITECGHLEFRLVHENSDRFIMNGEVPFGYELLIHQETLSTGKLQVNAVVAKDKSEAGLAGEIVKYAMVDHDAMGQPEIAFTLNQQSTSVFAEYTRTNIHRQVAIVVDGQLYSAPIVQTPILTGQCLISGHFDVKEARLMTALLEFPLPTPLTILETRTF